ncbi:highly ABA-induced PP2C gene 3 [Striga asiatica]|uniref:Highly ABA-induced PP2C gene 3 n=1 Tax=Striga asiatica TaxID=4170 RepID=A0A5A7PF88_STRAF|nr:highly ABA-induced PP2C gene 3 [Striga asiatica]
MITSKNYWACGPPPNIPTATAVTLAPPSNCPYPYHQALDPQNRTSPKTLRSSFPGDPQNRPNPGPTSRCLACPKTLKMMTCHPSSSSPVFSSPPWIFFYHKHMREREREREREICVWSLEGFEKM